MLSGKQKFKLVLWRTFWPNINKSPGYSFLQDTVPTHFCLIFSARKQWNKIEEMKQNWETGVLWSYSFMQGLKNKNFRSKPVFSLKMFQHNRKRIYLTTFFGVQNLSSLLYLIILDFVNWKNPPQFLFHFQRSKTLCQA